MPLKTSCGDIVCSGIGQFVLWQMKTGPQFHHGVGYVDDRPIEDAELLLVISVNKAEQLMYVLTSIDTGWVDLEQGNPQGYTPI